MDQLEYSGKPTAYDLKMITEPCEILQPFEEASDAAHREIIDI